MRNYILRAKDMTCGGETAKAQNIRKMLDSSPLAYIISGTNVFDKKMVLTAARQHTLPVEPTDFEWLKSSANGKHVGLVRLYYPSCLNTKFFQTFLANTALALL